MVLQASRQLYLFISKPRSSPLQTGTGGSRASNEEFDVEIGPSSVSDVSSGNVLFVADGGGSGYVRSWMDGTVSARVEEIKDKYPQLTIIAMDQNMSQCPLSRCCSSTNPDVAVKSPRTLVSRAAEASLYLIGLGRLSP